MEIKQYLGWGGGTYVVKMKKGITKLKLGFVFKNHVDNGYDIDTDFTFTFDELQYIDTFLVYYDMLTKEHTQLTIPYSSKHTFKYDSTKPNQPLQLNNIFTIQKEVSAINMKRLNNEPESIIKQLYGYVSPAGQIDIKDVTRYYAVTENGGDKLYDLISKLAGEFIRFKTTSPSSIY